MRKQCEPLRQGDNLLKQIHNEEKIFKIKRDLIYKGKGRYIEPNLYSELKKLGFCERCKHKHPLPLEIHHIKPVRLGGNNDRNNLMAVCGSCHDILDNKVR
jgi:5-methylcytosine-specific restriction endonuclease McrA